MENRWKKIIIVPNMKTTLLSNIVINTEIRYYGSIISEEKNEYNSIVKLII
jgi:hypothetical protein